MANTEENIKIKRSCKDCVFVDLFTSKSNVLKLYQSLNPDDLDCREEDVSIISLKNVLLNGIYNDLGFSVRGKLIVLVEAQSTWNINILVRMLYYLLHTCVEYDKYHPLNTFGSTPVDFPELQFYVIYTGTRKDIPDTISFKEVFLKNKASQNLDLKISVLKEENTNGITHQYISFCKILDSMVQKHGRGEVAIQNTITRCKDRDILKEYLQDREIEVTRMLADLFDQDTAVERYVDAMKKEFQDKTQELQDENQELQDENQELKDIISKNMEESINRHIELCFSIKMPQEEIIQRIMKEFDLSYEESSRRIQSLKK